jgi:membrane dipeptidase
MDRRNFLQSSAALSITAASTVAADAKLRDPVKALTANLNPSIQHAREVALKILKPSQKDLEKGLRLHAESVVFDSYGFSPRAAMDGKAYAAAVAEGASESELHDLREEMSMTRYVTDPDEQREYREAWRAAGVTCIFQNAGEEGQAPLTLLKRLARFTFTTDLMRDFVSKAVVPDDVLDAKKQNRHCLYFTGNGIPLSQEWVSMEGELGFVRIFFQLGIRMMHLTYQRRNMIGDGCGEKSDGGLSDFGRAAIAEMNRVGVIPDCAHSGWQTSLESAKASSHPVVASHSTCGGMFPHFRSKPNNVFKAIADSGGYVGICCIPRFLRGKGDISRLLDHIQFAVKTFGADHVAIGTDVAYSSQNSAAERKKIPRNGRKNRTAFRSLWPKDDYLTTAEARTSLAWTNWPLFTVGMVQRGIPEADIRKILGGNVLRVTGEALKRA